jgi:hypothetical protein
MRQLVAVALALMLPLGVAAQTVVVLQADFNGDTIGEPPDTSLPGPPDGDGITLTGVSENGSFLVSSASATLTNQPLEVVRTSGTTGFACSFDFPEQAYPCERVIMRWCAVAVTEIPPTFFSLHGPSGQFDFHGLLNFRTDRSITISSDVGVPNEVTVGSWAVGVAQCFEWQVDRSTGVQSLYIDGSPAIEDFSTTWSTTSAEAISFKYSMATQLPFTYALDDIEVSVADCGTPIEESTWGRIKSKYR